MSDVTGDTGPAPEPVPEVVPTGDTGAAPEPEPVPEVVPTGDTGAAPEPEPVPEPLPEPAPATEPVPEPAPIPLPTPAAEPIPSVVTPSGLTITPIHTFNYDVLNSKISSYLSMNQKPHITIYSDEAATQQAVDNNGNPVVEYEVNSVSVTNSYIDSVTNTPVNSSITLMFTNGARFKAIDGVDNYWFKVSAADFPIRTF